MVLGEKSLSDPLEFRAREHAEQRPSEIQRLLDRPVVEFTLRNVALLEPAGKEGQVQIR